MRLLRVELARFRARAAVRWAAVGLLVATVLLVLVAFTQARPMPPEEIAQLQAGFEASLEAWENEGDEWIAECEANQADDPAVDYGCDQMTAPVWEEWIGPTPTFATAGTGQIFALPLVAVGFALFVGATFVAAEMSTGAMGMWLTFEPRRSRVYWSKATAAAIGTLPAVLVACLLMVAGVYAVYAGFGRVGDTSSTTWTDLAHVTGRTLAATVLAALAGAALGTILRHTAAALGAVAVWYLVVESLVVPEIDEELQRWMLKTNLAAWVFGGTEYGVSECRVTDDGQMCEYVAREVTQTQGGLVLLGVATVLTVLAVVLFRRRDVS
ncbi:hypothetical protein [Oerskovia turbata]